MENLTVGCFVLALKIEGSKNVEALSMHKMPTAVSSMLSKDNIMSLHLRYLDEKQREIAKPFFDWILINDYFKLYSDWF